MDGGSDAIVEFVRVLKKCDSPSSRAKARAVALPRSNPMAKWSYSDLRGGGRRALPCATIDWWAHHYSIR